jgi:putative addiction module component (TIGR02574 family)
MKMTLLEEARHLPISERIELVEAIWHTIGEDASPDALPVSAAHRAELDRRLADLELAPLGRGCARLPPWNESPRFFGRLRKRT